MVSSKGLNEHFAAQRARAPSPLTDEQKEGVETRLAEGLSLIEDLEELFTTSVDTIGELEDLQSEIAGILEGLENIVADTKYDGPIFNQKPVKVVKFSEVLYRLNGRFQGGVTVRKHPRDRDMVRIGKPRSPIYSAVMPFEVINIARGLGVIGKRDKVSF